MLDNTEGLLSIRIFGSTIRGENDEFSDTDILIVTNDSFRDMTKVASALQTYRNVDISQYAPDRLIEMFATGHLFAWHLFLESKSLNKNVEDTWFQSLQKPQPYNEGAIDLIQFNALLQDSIDSLHAGSDYIYEAGICFLAARNIGMVASVMSGLTPDFSRHSPLRLSQARLDMSANEFEMLANCRRISARGRNITPPSFAQVTTLLPRLKNWANTVLETYE